MDVRIFIEPLLAKLLAGAFEAGRVDPIHVPDGAKLVSSGYKAAMGCQPREIEGFTGTRHPSPTR